MDDSLLSVGALHALVYCERLFYLEEVERIRVADAAVYAGRRLHAEIERGIIGDDATGTERLTFESARLGLRGAVDVLRRRDGKLVPYEHKRGRAAGKPQAREAWPSDRIQLGAYALLVEEASGESVDEGRLRYHADGVTVRVPVDDALRASVGRAVARARALRESTERPPITDNERLCLRCSLAPACLPEEARLSADPRHRPIRLLPPHPCGKTIHVSAHGARVSRRANELVVSGDGAQETRLPVHEVGTIVLHGFAQISTQALRLCAEHDVPVHWMTMGGGLTGSLAPTAVSAQRHIRQFEALRDDRLRLHLARRLVGAKVENQLRFVLRATRGTERQAVVPAVRLMRASLRQVARAASPGELLGLEGSAAMAYFGVLPQLIAPEVDALLRPAGRSRMPARDRFNVLLNYGYGMLYREVLAALVAVGLHPGFGFYHRPRSAAHTLALDLMEIFRVVLVDMPVVAAVNRRTFDAARDFAEAGSGFTLNEAGKRKLIEVIERRKQDTWRHSVVGYSLSYARMIELEARLLEKEWCGETGLFAKFRIR